MPPLIVKCPTCGRKLEWSEASPFRPFCSERCKLIDFGAWATERHTIPGEPVDSELDENKLSKNGPDGAERPDAD